ncbi:MAG: helix-turn-helix domain-containing protein [Methanosarcina mazei]|nr:MAG: helix-turn-helix domain-containing protein [Methanosarcina mazei]
MKHRQIKTDQHFFEEFTAPRESEAFFRQIVEQLPFPMEIFLPDGTAVMVNKALLDASGIPSAELIVGKYNILKDPSIEERGIKDYVVRAFRGEAVHFTDIKVPLKQIKDVYGIKDDGIISVYQDIVIFPVTSLEGKVTHVVVFFKGERKYNVTENINQSINFLKENYQNEYCMEDAARAANLSPYHFIRVFKSQTGKTPYEFLLDIKMQKAKEMLNNNTQRITDISLTLGFSSPSHFARVFCKAAGMSPTAYRKNHIGNKKQ